MIVSMESLIELFCDWYGINIPILRNVQTINDLRFSELWTTKWFAKKEQQKKMDAYLKKYEHLFELSIDDFQDVPAPYNRIIQISFMILWDQVSRNIYRNTAKAYATDTKARQLVVEIMKHWSSLPFAVKVSCILVYIHSEDIADLSITEMLLKDLHEVKNFPSVKGSLFGIARNHSERMKCFGRIPERNAFLKRESTPQEIVYMTAVLY